MVFAATYRNSFSNIDLNQNQFSLQGEQPMLIHHGHPNFGVMQGGGPNQGTQNLSPEQQQLTKQILQHQRFLNPTGQARFTPDQNPTLQMVDPNYDVHVTGAYQSTQECWGKFCGCLATYFCCCCCQAPYAIVPQGFSGAVQRFGKFYKLVAPGMHYLNPELDRLVLVDKREQVLLLKRQIVQTKDNVTITIDAVVYYKVVDTYKSKFAVRDLVASIKDLTETSVRNAIGRMTLQDVLEKREELSESVLQQMTKPVFNWGAAITRALIQEIIFAKDQLDKMSQGAISKKIGEAFIIQSQADVEAARLMKEAAAILNTEAAMQIRYLESLEAIAKTENPKFVFFPADYSEIGAANETEHEYIL